MNGSDLMTRFEQLGDSSSAVHKLATAVLQGVLFALHDRSDDAPPTVADIRLHLSLAHIRELLSHPATSGGSRAYLKAYLATIDGPAVVGDSGRQHGWESHAAVQLYLTQALTLMEA